MSMQNASIRSWTRRTRLALAAVAAAIMLTGCGTAPPAEATPRSAALTVQPADNGILTFAALTQQARILDGGRALQCVPYARQLSGIDLYGNAGSWWTAAKGRYARSQAPENGAVLVFRRTQRSVGHLAVVTRVVTDRLIVASHANWLNNGRIHEGTPIEDISKKGDWSSVRVWYTPGGSWGRTHYATAGFILPKPPQVASRTAM
jgi:hypothetical protein